MLLFTGHVVMAQCNSANYNPELCNAQGTTFEPGLQATSFNDLAAASNTFYMRSNVGNPWGSTTNQQAMNTAFGAGNWTEVFFETADPATVFSSATRFVFMEGSDSNANELNAFLTANLTTIENWVAQGKTLFLNAAPNEGGNINFGFGGTTLVYPDYSDNVTVVDTGHPIFTGPNLPVSQAMSGTTFAHASISGTGYTNLITDSGVPTRVVLAEKSWGNGQVAVGGMTTTDFHSPAAESFNIRANLLVYLESRLVSSIDCPADIVVSNDSGECGAVVTFPNATATDSNGNAIPTTQTAGPASGSFFPVGDTLIEFSADDNGTIITCTFTITVNDTEAPIITCPGDITQDNDPGICGAVVTYTIPTATDNCGSTSSNILFVSDNGDASEIETALTSEGYTVTAVYNDFSGGDNATLQGSLSSYELIYWHASGANGYGETHNSSTFTNLDAFVANGGNVFVTGYDVIVSPVDINLITFLGGTSSNDVGPSNGTLIGPNSITTGFANTTGMSIIAPNDDQDNLNGLAPTVTVVLPGSASGGAEWGINDVPGGEIAWVSSGQFDGSSFPSWTTLGSGYHEALLNFAFNSSSPTINVVQTAGLPSGSEFPVGTTTNTFVVTDASGNTATCSFDVTINDTEAPIANCVAPFTLALDANGEASINPEMIDNGSTDNCGNVTLSFGFVENGFNGDFAPANWSFNANGGTGSFFFDPSNENVTITGSDGGSANNINTTLCNTIANDGVIQFDWSYVTNDGPTFDPFGYSLNGTFVSLTDSFGPQNQNGTANIPIAAGDQFCFVANTLDDVFGSATTVSGMFVFDGTSQSEFTCADLGVNTIMLTVTDDSGNMTTCTTEVTIVDDLAPEITCVTNQTVDTDAGVCDYTHSGTAWDATATDNCTATVAYELTDATTGTGTTLNGVAFNLGETTVTWTATDGSGNTAICSFTVTVEDNEVPVITCISNQTMNTDVGFCSYTHNGTAWDATATDNCSIAAITYALTGANTGTGTSLDGVAFNLGITTVTWTTTDGSGNSDNCSFTVTVEDNQVPVIACVGNQTMDTDAGVCTYTHSGTAWDATATDNCSVATITYVLTGATTGTGTTLNGVAFNLGETTVTWTATDGSGNTDICSFTVTIEDNEAPVISCVANQTVDTNTNVCTYTHNGTAWDATATDNCSVSSISYELTGATTGTGTTLDGVTFNLGDTTVTFTTTDGSGNTAVCSFTVTVEDNQAPQIVCPLDIIIDAEPGMCSAQVFFGNATALDNCSGFLPTVQTEGPVSGSIFPIGDTVISFMATDNAGNVSTCSFTITVVDNQAPLAVCQNITIQLDANGFATITAEDLDGGSTDNCGSALTFTASQTAFDCSHVGNNTITLTVTDAAGNSSTCTAIVTVEDNIAPVAQCVAPFTIQLDATGNASITAADIDNGSTDNCGVASMILSQSAFTCADLGENTITLTITDPSGNSTTCTTTVTVEDNSNPIVTCIDFTLALGPDGTALLTPEDIGGTSTDNCAITITAIDIEEFDCSDIGTPVLVTYFASDSSGNIASCTAMVTVVDTLGPVIDCPLDQTVDSDPDSITYTLPDYFGEGIVTATDNCTIPVTIFSQSPAPGTLLLDGTYTITLTATDAFDNESVCTFELIVDTILGRDDNRLDFSSLTLYPNPAEYTVTIGNPKFMAIDNINVYDIQGRLVLSKNTGGATGNQTLEVGHLASAVYMVVIESNGKQAVKRLIRK